MASFSGSFCATLIFMPVFRTHPALAFVCGFLGGVLLSFPALMMVLVAGGREFAGFLHSRIRRRATLWLGMIGGLAGAVPPLAVIPFLPIDFTDPVQLGLCGRGILALFCYGSCLGTFASLHQPASGGGED